MIERKLSDGARLNSFSSYQELITRALGPSDMPAGARHSRTNDDGWSGGSWKDAETLGPSGDIASARRLQRAIIKQANTLRGQTVRMDPIYRQEGGLAVDVARYLTGEPECWLDMTDSGATRPARHATIIFNATASSVVTVAAFERVSIAIGGALLGLKSIGIPVTLYLAYANKGNKYTTIDAANMSGATGSLDMATLAATCQTWFFRRMIFSLWETYSAKFRANHNIGAGYGRTTSVSQSQADEITGRAGTLVLNLAEMVRKSPDEIRMQIQNTITKREVTPR